MAGFKEYQMLFQLNANLGSNYSSTFSSGSKAITDLQNKIEGLNRTQSDIAAFEKQQKAVDSCKTKMELYATQLDNLKNATASSSVEEAKLANEIAAKEVQLQKATTAYDNANAKLSDMGQKLRDAGVDTSNLSAEEARLADEANKAAAEQEALATESTEMGQSFKTAMEGAAAAIEAAGLISGLKKIYDALADCSGAAMEFETAMAGVKRTVGGDDAFISNLGETFKELSTTIPITANELASIATTAGQLGIPQQNVEEFTTVMAQLATTTDLTADNAATMLAQFSNITGVDEYDRLGSTVAYLGDATATTASKVVDMSQGMAAAASIAGLSATDILAISAAVGSLGIEAQAGSTAMSTLISNLYKAVETGDGLSEFASVAGMSAEQFKTAWGEDAAGALNAFIQGLNDTERNGASAIVILDELGITNVRQTKAILGLASAGDLLSNTIASANTAWESNTSLVDKASIMYGTTEAKLTMMQNAANNVKIAIGDALNPALGAAADAATQLLQPLAEFISQNPALVQGITAFVGVLGGAAVAIAAYTAATKLAAAASTLFAGAIPGVGIILGVAAGIGVLVTAVSALSGPTETSSEKMNNLNSEYDALMDQISNDQKIIDLCDRYTELSERLNDTTLSSEELKAVQLELEATGDALIAASNGRITSLEGETQAVLAAVEAEKALAVARQAEARQQATENLKSQAKTYADVVADYEASMDRFTKAQEKLLDIGDINVLGLRIRNTFTEIQEALDLGADWNLPYIQELRTQLEELYSVATGGEFEGTFTSFYQMKDALRDLEITSEDVTASQVKLGQEMTEAGSAAETAAAAMQTYIDNAIDAVEKGGMSIEEVRGIMETAFAGYANGAELVDDAMAKVEAAVNGAADAAEDAAGSMETLNGTMEETAQMEKEAGTALNELEAELSELEQEYKDSYEAAYESISKQIGLFDNISVEVSTSVDDMIAALQSQAQYMDEYAANLQEAARMGIDEGLLKALSDGSTQSAAYLAEIVSNGEGKMNELNAAFRSVEEGKNDFAEIVAEMETNFSETSASIQAEKEALEASLNGMDASAAGSALGSTLAAGIRSKIEEVKKAAAELRAAATVDTGTGPASTSVAVNKNVTMAYASGTKNAKRGLALVGEEGPELMWMNGGETIATAEETARMARQAAVDASPLSAASKSSGNMVYKIEVKPEYNFSGTNMNEDELTRIMDQNTRNLRNQVERILNDIQSDKARSVYA